MALRDNLISWWELEEASGTRVDSHGSNDLADNNTVGTATGIINNGADFESSNSEYLSISDASQSGLDLGSGGTDFSISLWANFESLPGSGAYRTFFWKWNGGTNNRQYILDITYNGSVYKSAVLLSSNGLAGAYSDESVSFGSLSTATWYHIVYVYDASAGTLAVYLNNSLAGTHTGTPTSIFNGNADFWIANGQGFQDGVLDEIGIWNRTLDSSEISELYNSGNGLSYAATEGGGATFRPHIIMY